MNNFSTFFLSAFHLQKIIKFSFCIFLEIVSENFSFFFYCCCYVSSLNWFLHFIQNFVVSSVRVHVTNLLRGKKIRERKMSLENFLSIILLFLFSLNFLVLNKKKYNWILCWAFKLGLTPTCLTLLRFHLKPYSVLDLLTSGT